MAEIYVPGSSKLVRLKEQPHYPAEDLTDDNKDLLVYTLDQDGGIDAFAERLQYHQRYLYKVATLGLAQLGYKTKYTQSGMQAFSRGFAGFETISDLVHPPRIYNPDLAIGRVAQYLVDTTPSEPEIEDDFDAELQAMMQAAQPIEQDVEADEILMEPDYPSTELPKDILRSLASAKRERQQVTERDKPGVDQLFAKRHHIIPEYMPNTYTVLVRLGISRKENVDEIQARLAGAQFARTLQTID